jgi:flavin reductase (DIM6/NTAB) family NADH-FMN oxidoreductase RutF
MLIDLGDLAPKAVHHLMAQVVVPRPIAWVVSDNGSGDDDTRWNLAPFSYFNAVASVPPTVMVSVGVAGKQSSSVNGLKDTMTNLLERQEHTIALPTFAQRTAVDATSAQVPHGESEFGLAGLEAVAWDWPIPRPSGVRAAMGCTVDRIVPVADGPQRVVLSRVHVIWVDDEAATEDDRGRTVVDPVLLDPLSRLGAGLYGGLGPTVMTARNASRQS